jgi:hypothetical protein
MTCESFTMTGVPTMSSTQMFPRGSLTTSLRLARLAPLVASLGLVGCAAPQPGSDLPPFGETVEYTKRLQIYEPGDEVTPLGGAKAVEAMRGYRTRSAGGQQAVPMTSTSLP